MRDRKSEWVGQKDVRGLRTYPFFNPAYLMHFVHEGGCPRDASKYEREKSMRETREFSGGALVYTCTYDALWYIFRQRPKYGTFMVLYILFFTHFNLFPADFNPLSIVLGLSFTSPLFIPRLYIYSLSQCHGPVLYFIHSCQKFLRYLPSELSS